MKTLKPHFFSLKMVNIFDDLIFIHFTNVWKFQQICSKFGGFITKNK